GEEAAAGTGPAQLLPGRRRRHHGPADHRRGQGPAAPGGPPPDRRRERRHPEGPGQLPGPRQPPDGWLTAITTSGRRLNRAHPARKTLFSIKNGQPEIWLASLRWAPAIGLEPITYRLTAGRSADCATRDCLAPGAAWPLPRAGP